MIKAKQQNPICPRITDRNGREIKEGDLIKYRYDDYSEVGGLCVVAQNGELGTLEDIVCGTIGEKEFVKLSTTDLAHCEVMEYVEKGN